MSDQPEGKLSRQIIEAIRAQNGWAFKVHGSEMQPAGLPDIIACIDGRFIGLETKMPGKEDTVTQIQFAMHNKIRAAGGVCEVVTSVQAAMKVCGYA